MSASHNPRLHLYAVLTAACTLLLVVAGALVTSNDAGLAVPDWPLSYGSLLPPMVGGIFWEHGHRMIATLVGLLTIGLAVWINRADSRPWMRKLGWIALAAVVAQGVLGGITVLFFLPRPVSIAHASLAQLFFCLTVSVALFTSRWWQSDLQRVRYAGRPPVRARAIRAAVAIFIQLVLGAAYRHGAINEIPHVLWAAVVLVLVVVAVDSTRDRRLNAAPTLHRAGMVLASFVCLQMILGPATWWVRMESQFDPQPLPLVVTFTVLHVAVGAMALAASVVFVLCCFRQLHSVIAAEATVRSEQVSSLGEAR